MFMGVRPLELLYAFIIHTRSSSPHETDHVSQLVQEGYLSEQISQAVNVFDNVTNNPVKHRNPVKLRLICFVPSCGWITKSTIGLSDIRSVVIHTYCCVNRARAQYALCMLL